jgi:prevent-host-death family protein
MSPVSIEEAQAHLPELVAAAAAGAVVVIAENGRPKARLVQIEPNPLDFEAWATLDDELFEPESASATQLMLLHVGAR